MSQKRRWDVMPHILWCQQTSINKSNQSDEHPSINEVKEWSIMRWIKKKFTISSFVLEDIFTSAASMERHNISISPFLIYAECLPYCNALQIHSSNVFYSTKNLSHFTEICDKKWKWMDLCTFLCFFVNRKELREMEIWARQ